MLPAIFSGTASGRRNNIMGTLLAVGAGGALGSVARYCLTLLSERYLGADFPYGTLTVNILGSLAAGVCLVLLLERTLLPDIWRLLLMTGFLGGFTTFSAFSLQTLNFLQEGRFLAAAVYVLGSVLLSLAATGAGMLTARSFW